MSEETPKASEFMVKAKKAMTNDKLYSGDVNSPEWTQNESRAWLAFCDRHGGNYSVEPDQVAQSAEFRITLDKYSSGEYNTSETEAKPSQDKTTMTADENTESLSDTDKAALEETNKPAATENLQGKTEEQLNNQNQNQQNNPQQNLNTQQNTNTQEPPKPGQNASDDTKSKSKQGAGKTESSVRTR